MNMGGGEWWEAGLAKAAKQLCKGSGTREQWKMAVQEEDEEEDEPAGAQGKGQMRGAKGEVVRPRDSQERVGVLNRLASSMAAIGGGGKVTTELLPRGGLELDSSASISIAVIGGGSDSYGRRAPMGGGAACDANVGASRDRRATGRSSQAV